MLDVGVLALIWLAGWGVAFWLIRRGVTYINNPLLTSLTFLAFSTLLIGRFGHRLGALTAGLPATPWVVLLLVVAVTVAVYAVVPRVLDRPAELIARHPEEFYLVMDFRYLVSKSFEVLFQQLVIAVLALLLAAEGLSLPGVVLVFLVLFGLLHLPMILLVGKGLGAAYLLAAATLAAVFPALILRLPGGVVYSYAAHWCFYTILAVLAWLWHGHQGRRVTPGKA